MAPHLGGDRAEAGNTPEAAGQAGTSAPADSTPDSRKEGSEGAAGAPRTLVRSDLQAPQPPTATTAKTPTRDPFRPPGSPGPRTPADLPLALAPTVSATARASSSGRAAHGRTLQATSKAALLPPRPAAGGNRGPEVGTGGNGPKGGLGGDGSRSKAPFAPTWALQLHAS